MQILQKINCCCLLFMLLIAITNGQRVAPGVNPQQYQHQQQYQQAPPVPHQQQYQQQPPQQHVPPGVAPQQYQQYQQVPVQQPVQQQQQHQQYQQQVPQQQQQQYQQQPPVVQQVPQQQQHQGHATHQPHGHPQQVLNAANIEHERAHIQEHIQVPIDTSKMSEAELQFHYFKMHDSDNNNKLDGCELIKSLIHWHAHEKIEAKNQTDTAEATKTNDDADADNEHKEGTVYTDKSLGEIIDYVLKTMDLNDDGYVDYAEYRQSEKELDKN